MHFSSKCSSKLGNFNLYKSDFHQSHFDKNHWPGNSLVAQWLECCAFSAWPGFDSWLGNAWRKKWQPTPVFLPGKSHRRRSLVGYSPRGRKELDTTKQLHLGNSDSNNLHRKKKKKATDLQLFAFTLKSSLDKLLPTFFPHDIFLRLVLSCPFLCPVLKTNPLGGWGHLDSEICY